MTPEPQHPSWKIPFFSAAFCLFILLMINDVAMRLYLFSGYPWIDIPLHFLGGFCVGLASLGVLRFIYRGEKYIASPKFLYIIVMTLGVGLVWEFVEWYLEASVAFGGNFWFDTKKDLLMDTLGGILSYICFHPHEKNTPRSL